LVADGGDLWSMGGDKMYDSVSKNEEIMMERIDESKIEVDFFNPDDMRL
jgi:hypothetical protein